VYVIRFFLWFLRFVGDIINEFLEKNVPFMCASISFYAFFSLFPLLLALIMIFSIFIGIRDFEEIIIDSLMNLIPIFDEQDDEFLKTFFDSLTSNRLATSTLAAIGLLFASSAVFGTIRKSINFIWEIDKKRTFFQERKIDFSMLFLASSLLIGSIVLTTGLSFLSELIAITFPDSPLIDPNIWNRMALLVPPLLTFLVFLICFWWLPNIELSFISVFPAAVIATLAEEITKMLFILYLRNFSGISGSIYGGVSAIIVFMAFIYISSIILLVGAQVTVRNNIYINIRKQNHQNNILQSSIDRLN
jgi:membrane protein